MEVNSAFEIFIGVVAPLGTERKWFIDVLEEKFDARGYHIERISITKEIIHFAKNNCHALSFEYFVKMEACSELRKKYSNGFLMGVIIDKIRSLRKKENKKVVYIIEQIKNVTEYNILSHVYGLNYLQISLFSNEKSRDENLRVKFKNDCVNNLVNYTFSPHKINFFKKHLNEDINNLFQDIKKDIYTKFEEQILPDVTHNLIKKDFNEIIASDSNSHGQQVSELFHLSHYFFNLDESKIDIAKELNKFISLIVGDHEDYPTQDEFGMSLAFQVSVRSNFPNNRHIGAAILSPYGEVISVASIRAPCSSSNTTLFDQYQVQDGYTKFKNQIKEWKKFLKEFEKKKDIDSEEKSKLGDISNFLKDSLDFHPCTHAEIAAIIDAAKLGISVRKSTLYTTTFPCHLCAKEIINAGISKVIYLEAYPKSKNKELYPKLIDFDPSHASSLLPFSFYSGIGPKRFMYVYSVKNKNKKSKYPPLLAYERSIYYEKKEKDIIDYLSNINHENIHFLDSLFQKEGDL
ncbi:TPA: deaminase [Legionella anisa]